MPQLRPRFVSSQSLHVFLWFAVSTHLWKKSHCGSSSQNIPNIWLSDALSYFKIKIKKCETTNQSFFTTEQRWSRATCAWGPRGHGLRFAPCYQCASLHGQHWPAHLQQPVLGSLQRFWRFWGNPDGMEQQLLNTWAEKWFTHQEWKLLLTCNNQESTFQTGFVWKIWKRSKPQIHSYHKHH